MRDDRWEWTRTHDLEELRGEVGALGEVDDLGVNSILRIAELSTVGGVLKLLLRLDRDAYIASSGAAAQTDMPKV